MKEIMAIKEIEARFDSEWVLLKNPVTTESLEIKGGEVLCHSKDRDEVYRKAREFRPKHSAILYIGQLADETAIVL